MPLHKGTICPLNVAGCRKVDFPAAHFHYTTINKYNKELIEKLDLWIYQNLSGRYYIGESVGLVNNSIVYVTSIGFEKAKELSFFTLANPVS